MMQGLPESLDPDSVLEGAWAQTQHPVDWPQPQSLEGPLAAFRHWLRHLLWELTLLLAQVTNCPICCAVPAVLSLQSCFIHQKIKSCFCLTIGDSIQQGHSAIPFEE